MSQIVLPNDPMDRWCRQVGFDRDTAQEIVDWVLERLDGARAGNVHPVVFLQTALLMWHIGVEACQLPPGRAEELMRASWPHAQAVARSVMESSEATGARLAANGLEVVG